MSSKLWDTSSSQFIYQHACVWKDWTLDEELLISSHFTFGDGAKAEVNENRLSALGAVSVMSCRWGGLVRCYTWKHNKTYIGWLVELFLLMGCLTPCLEFGVREGWPSGFEECSFLKMDVSFFQPVPLVLLWWLIKGAMLPSWKPSSPGYATLRCTKGWYPARSAGTWSVYWSTFSNYEDVECWYHHLISRMCLYQTCHFLGGVYLLGLPSFTRELP